MLDTIGHNLAGAGKMLKPVLPRKKAKTPDAPKARFPYFKFYPRDWLEATRNLTVEARGAYIDLLCIMWEMEGHLADNDKWIAHQMHVSPRKWRSLKGDLVEHEKISIDDGKIINDRCLNELDQLLSQRKNIAEASAAREQKKRETSSKVPGNIRETSVKHPGNNFENSEKTNENNAANTTIAPLRALAIDLDSDLEERKERKKEQPASSESVAARGMYDEIEGLNGATISMQMTIAKWMSPIMPRHQEARTWLTNTVQLFGSDIARDAFASVEAKHAQGDIVGAPIKLMTAICQKMAGERKKGKGSTGELSQRPPGMPEAVWQEILAGQAKV